MGVRNKLLELRLKMGYKFQKDFAEFLGVSRFSINQWENQKKQPNVETLCMIFEKLKKELPDLHMEDLIEYEPDD